MGKQVALAQPEGVKVIYANDPWSTPFEELLDAHGETLVRVELYGDQNPEAPTAYGRYSARMSEFGVNESADWKTVVLDSLTFVELAARNNERYHLNPTARDPRQWWAGATDTLERLLMGVFAHLPMNLVVVAHIDDDKDELHGEIVRNPAAPGRLRKRLGSAFAETYHVYVAPKKGDEEKKYCLQTQSDGRFAAGTQIDAPSPITVNGPAYELLWANAPGPRHPIHVLLYGEWGSGKSTIAASFPKPMLVWGFDPLGKERPYLKV